MCFQIVHERHVVKGKETALKYFRCTKIVIYNGQKFQCMFKKRTDKIKLDHKHFYDFQTISRDIRTYYKSDEEIKPNKDIMENVYKFIGTNNISISAGSKSL